MVIVNIPLAWLQDASDSLDQIAEEQGGGFASLVAKIEAAPAVRRGRGSVVPVDLDDEELACLFGEAKYRNTYWNTDAYGIKESGSTIPQYARAAKRLFEQMKPLVKGA